MAMSPPLTETQVPSAAPENRFATKDFLQFGASLLALLSLLLFAIAYWAITEYFGVFGLTPEQVGIDKQTLLTRVGVIAAFLAAFGVPVLTACAVFIKRATPCAWRGALRESPVLTSLALGSVLGAAVVAPGWHPLRSSDVLALVGFFSAAVYAPFIHYLHKRGCSTAALCLVTLATLGLTLTPWIGDKARDSAEGLRDHGSVSGLATFIGVRPAFADVSWTDLDNQPQHRMVILLGEGNGMTVFLPCGQEAVQRVPSTQVRLSYTGVFSRSRTLCSP
ncbi:hypothetical protein ACFWIQ_10315 [Kitasatospora sp. NPDC127059]|uniref:hypothetical protein n=1 Tax=unclassified Kitasatospora TaxID=2633591 RepID=UPI003649A71B